MCGDYLTPIDVFWPLTRLCNVSNVSSKKNTSLCILFAFKTELVA